MAEDIYTIDALDKSLGRVASEAAHVLLGKSGTSFTRNQITGPRVVIENAAHLKLSEGKRMGKEYTRYTGYPGGLRTDTLQQLIDRRGYAEVVRKAVYGMLPGNKLRPRLMKRLEIRE